MMPSTIQMRFSRSLLELAVIGLLIFLAPLEGSAAFRGRRLDEVIPEGAGSGSATNNGTSGSGGPSAAAAAAAAAASSSSATEGGSAVASDATTQAAASASFQPRVTVVEGLQSRNGIASISNPGTNRKMDVVEEQGFVQIVFNKSAM
jgi:hypothetical protein